MPTMPDLDNLTCRRSTRVRNSPVRFDPSATLTFANFFGFASDDTRPTCSDQTITDPTVTNGHLDKNVHNSISNKIFLDKAVSHTQLINQNFDKTLNFYNPTVYLSENAENDTYTFKSMLKQPDKHEFI